MLLPEGRSETDILGALRHTRALLPNVAATTPSSTHPLVWASVRARQQGAVACGEADSSASSSGQTPGRSWLCGVPVVLPTHSTPGTP